MQTKSEKAKLTPQTEEDIEQAIWVPAKAIADYRLGSYPLIWDLIKEFALPVAK